MKLKLPVEHRIQLMAEKYSDADLQECAMEVAEVKRALESLRDARAKFNRQTEVVIWVSMTIIGMVFLIRFFH